MSPEITEFIHKTKRCHGNKSLWKQQEIKCCREILIDPQIYPFNELQCQTFNSFPVFSLNLPY